MSFSRPTTFDSHTAARDTAPDYCNFEMDDLLAPLQDIFEAQIVSNITSPQCPRRSNTLTLWRIKDATETNYILSCSGLPRPENCRVPSHGTSFYLRRGFTLHLLLIASRPDLTPPSHARATRYTHTTQKITPTLFTGNRIRNRIHLPRCASDRLDRAAGNSSDHAHRRPCLAVLQ